MRGDATMRAPGFRGGNAGPGEMAPRTRPQRAALHGRFANPYLRYIRRIY